MRNISILFMFAILLLTGCTAKQPASAGSYTQISQEEAKKMMKADDGHVIVDVRRQDEYDAGHIPGAVLIPNESIGSEQPEALPDLNQVILIYCRSGNRSKQAAQKLYDMGYTKVYEFGGINDWTGETVAGESAADSAAPENMEDIWADAIRPTATLVMEVNGKVYYPDLAENASAKAFFEKLREGSLTVDLHDYGGFEKVGPLPWELPRSDEKITTVPGDIILYQGDHITI